MPAPAPITSKSNARVKALRASFSGKASQPGDLLGLEGEHLIGEAIRSGLKLETVFLREGSENVLDRPALAAIEARSTLALSRDVFASAVETASPQGIAATVLIPTIPPPTPQPQSLSLSSKASRTPATSARSSAPPKPSARNKSSSPPTPSTPGTPRSSAPPPVPSSACLSPVRRSPKSQVNSSSRELSSTPPSPSPSNSISLLDITFAPHAAILIGNEGAGLSPEALALSEVLVRIPCAVESLNAAIAGSTLLYEALRQRAASNP